MRRRHADSFATRLLPLFFFLPGLACSWGEQTPVQGSDAGGEEAGDADRDAPDTSIVFNQDAGAETDAGPGGGGNDSGGVPDAEVDADDAGAADAGCPLTACSGLCGPVRNPCSGLFDQCGRCETGFVCSLETHLCVVPAADCAALGAECGPIRNSCGQRLDCGDCADLLTECDRNSHRCVPCSNPTCADLGYECGEVWLGCGPFSNVTSCGDCPEGQVCNAAFNVCEPECVPAADAERCAAEGAECGFVSNGCGGLSACGDCPEGTKCGARGIGNRCDPPEVPDECVAAGRECGEMESACGGHIACGVCSDPAHVCGPDGRCGPPCIPRACDRRPYVGRCGAGLSDGCSGPGGLPGTIDCPCAEGLVCSTQAPGRTGSCVPPSGCAVFGATGGAGEACSNGPSRGFPVGDGTNLACPCTGGGLCMKDGAVVSGDETGRCCVNTVACVSFECNVTKKNACIGSDIVCACTQPGLHCNTSTNTCEPDKACGAYTDGAEPSPCSGGPSPAFPRGDGANLVCPCTQAGAQCFGSVQAGADWTAGACCVPDACPENTCAEITNHCDGTRVQCPCSDPKTHCNAGTGTCDADLTCASYNANGAEGDLCSNGPAFSDGAAPPSLFSCPCAGAQMYCTDGAKVVPGTGCGAVSAAACSGDADCGGKKCIGGRCADPCAIGTCCQNTVSCGGACNNTILKNGCTGQVLSCPCPAGQYCNAPADGVCVSNKTCSDYGANGRAGDPCTTLPHTNPAWPKQPPNASPALACGCSGGRICSVAGSPPHTAGAGEVGVCCTNTVSCGGKCNNTLLKNSCSDALLTCNCPANKHCNAAADGECEDNATCSDYGANGAPGQPCSNGNDPADFPRYPGDVLGLTCKCKAGNCYKNNAVVSGAVKGTCCTPPPIPKGDIGDPCTPVHDDCTNTDLPRPCAAGNYCKNGFCAALETCGSYGADGVQGHVCADQANPSWPKGDGTFLSCPCSTAAPFENAFCGDGVCACVPDVPANCGDDGKPDGCGGTMVAACAGPEVCYQNACCAPPVCPAGADGDLCGEINNCGLSVTCPCTQQHMTCGGGGAPGRCGCTPKTQANCSALGPGVHPDGCGGTVTCKA